MILIRSAKVIDGTGKPAYTADVLIEKDRISAIGYFPNKTADKIIDGTGYYLAPGFIDIHSDIDHSLSIFSNPEQKEYLSQGVTTIIGGNCGSSLAPLLYGTLESIQKWTDINQINVDWQTMGDFLKVLERKKLGVNFFTLVGHSTIRRAIIGEVFRDLTDKELDVFKRVLSEAFEQGGLGFSTGLSYAHSQRTSFKEIEALAEIVKKYNGVYATHLRNEKEGLLNSINETIKIAEETGVKVIISHFRPLLENEENFKRALELLEKTKTETFFDVYPFDVSMMPIYKLLPLWTQNGGLAIMYKQLLDHQLFQRILKELPPLTRDDLTIASAPGNEFLIGKNIGEIAKNQGVTIPEALLKLMITTRLKALVFYKNINMSLVSELLIHPKSFISSNTIRLRGKAFPEFLRMVNGKLSIEEAIKKITSQPAQMFGLKERGIIKEDFFADLAMFKDQNASVIEVIIVNGQIK